MSNSKILSFSLLALLLLAAVVKADIAPPMINVNVTYAGMPINGTFNMSALICSNTSNVNTSISIPNIAQSYDAAKKCYWVFSEEPGAMCEDSECTLYYLPSDTFKAVFYLPALNKTFITNEINEGGYDTQYSAKLYSNGSATITTFSNPPYNPVYNPYGVYVVFMLALLLTLAIEVAVAFLYLRAVKIKNKRRILLSVVLANIISVPILWFFFVYFLAVSGFVLGEIFAVVFEGGFVYCLNKKTIKLKRAMTMSLVMNLSSLILGGLILLLSSLI